MKTIPFLVSGVLLMSLFAVAQLKPEYLQHVSSDPLPHTGISVADLEKALAEIRPSLPTKKDENILSLFFPSSDAMEVKTGIQSGPRAGRGRLLDFRRTNGKWQKTGEGRWVS